MATQALNFQATAAETHCGACGKGIDEDKQFASYCADCEEWMCKSESCQHCGCDRLALKVQRSINRLQPSLLVRVRRWFNHGV
jgi:hypothetical protein